MAVTAPAPAVEREPVHGFTLDDAWRSFRTAIGLGWAVESNWSDPFLFAVYTLAKPISAALILVLMVQVISGGQAGDFLQFLIVGSALWNVVLGAMNGLVMSIMEDRERYRMMKYVVVTPTSLFPFLLGRSVARILISFVAVAITLLLGIVLLGVEPRPNLLLVPATLLGMAAILALGIIMAGWCLQMRQEAWAYPEALGGALYMLSGAVFPIDVLPGFLQPISYALPTTWWLELSRRGLLSDGAPGALASLSDATVLLLLVVTTAVFVPVALGAFRLFIRRARQLGLLDMTTGS